MRASAQQVAKAEAFLRLHLEPPLLVLPNAWDVVSARLLARRPGCRAIGTTSAGVAAVLGHPDGERIPVDVMIAAVGRIAHAVDLPVTADLEAGYAATADGVAEHVAAAIAAGAVGVNLEDTRDDPARAAPHRPAEGAAAGAARRAAPDRPAEGAGPGAAEPVGGALLPLDEAVERVAAGRAAADRAGVPAVVNARTDVYLAAVGDPADRFEHTVSRLSAYRGAGADCLFVPGLTDPGLLGALAARLGAPLNVLAAPALPPADRLAALGIARLSAGSGLHRAVLAHLAPLADRFLGEADGTWLRDAIPYADLQAALR